MLDPTGECLILYVDSVQPRKRQSSVRLTVFFPSARVPAVAAPIIIPARRRQLYESLADKNLIACGLVRSLWAFALTLLHISLITDKCWIKVVE